MLVKRTKVRKHLPWPLLSYLKAEEIFRVIATMDNELTKIKTKVSMLRPQRRKNLYPWTFWRDWTMDFRPKFLLGKHYMFLQLSHFYMPSVFTCC